MTKSERGTEEFAFLPDEEKASGRLQTESRESAGLLMEALKTGDKQMEIRAYLESAKSRLSRMFGVDNLRIIEASHLRRIVEEIMPQWKKEEELTIQGEMQPDWLFDMEVEAAALWLYRLYGIHNNDVPVVYAIRDEDDQKTYIYQKTQKEESRRKEEELKRQGHKTSWGISVPDDFKEYIRRLRENAHNFPTERDEST